MKNRSIASTEGASGLLWSQGAKLRFGLLAAGQMISALGTGLTAFAISIILYRHGGSATVFALIGLFSTLPGALLLPLVGPIIDRHDRRSTMLLGTMGSGVAVLLVALMQHVGILHIGLLCLLAATVSICNTMSSLAFASSIIHLVPRARIGNANAFLQMGPALAQIISPALGGLMVSLLPVETLLIVDGASYFCLHAVLWLVRFPSLEIEQRAGSFLKRALEGWRLLREHRGIVRLTIGGAICDSGMQCTQLLLSPFLLAMTTPRQFGIAMSVIFSGMVVGSVLATVIGMTRQMVKIMLAYRLAQAIGLFVVGVMPRLSVVVIVFTVVSFLAAFGMTARQTLIQISTPPAAHGRVFANLNLLGSLSLPISFLVAGPFVDKVIKPTVLIHNTGWLGHALAALGPEGGAIAVLFELLAIVVLIAAIATFTGTSVQALAAKLVVAESAEARPAPSQSDTGVPGAAKAL